MAAKKSAPLPELSPAKQLDGFIDKFAPEICKLIRMGRRELRKRMPTAFELVYDNYNALAIGFAATERTATVLISLAGFARGVNLYFYYGAHLPDPLKILLGSGTQGRFIRLEGLETFKKAGVEALIKASMKYAEPSLARSEKGVLIIKSISARQRPRRI